MKYALMYDTNATVFSHIDILRKNVPRMSLLNIDTDNCAYNSMIARSKDCYLNLGNHSERCMYSYMTVHAHDVCDGYFVAQSQVVFESFYIKNSSYIFYSSFLEHCEYCWGSVGCV